MGKREIRNRILEKRDALSFEEQQRKSSKIFSLLTDHPLYKEAEEVYCYASFGSEVDTRGIVENSLRLGKKVALPKILVNKVMEFYYINSLKELKKGHYGIMEPPPDNRALKSTALVIMPGVAFDKSGGRIGYGGGYYDAYLSLHPILRRIALAFEVQCLEYLPTEEHDIRPEILMTEKGVYLC